MIKEYAILAAGTADLLTDLVNIAIGHGWQPHGGIAVVGGRVLHQPIVRTKPIDVAIEPEDEMIAGMEKGMS